MDFDHLVPVGASLWEVVRFLLAAVGVVLHVLLGARDNWQDVRAVGSAHTRVRKMLAWANLRSSGAATIVQLCLALSAINAMTFVTSISVATSLRTNILYLVMSSALICASTHNWYARRQIRRIQREEAKSERKTGVIPGD